MRFKDQVSELEAKVQPKPTKIPDLWAIYLLEDKWGMKAGDCITTATKKQVGGMDREGVFVYSRRKRSEDAQWQADQRWGEEMNRRYIDSRDGAMISMNRIVRDRGDIVSKTMTITRGKGDRAYFFNFKEGPLQGGISGFLFNQFNIPMEIQYRL